MGFFIIFCHYFKIFIINLTINLKEWLLSVVIIQRSNVLICLEQQPLSLIINSEIPGIFSCGAELGLNPMLYSFRDNLYDVWIISYSDPIVNENVYTLPAMKKAMYIILHVKIIRNVYLLVAGSFLVSLNTLTLPPLLKTSSTSPVVCTASA